MKNRIRVRKNRNAVKPASQVKKPASKSRSDDVTLTFINQATGEIEDKLEIPKPLHDAMIRDALAKGISLQQWVKSAVQEKAAANLAESKTPAPPVGEVSLILFDDAQGVSIDQLHMTNEEFQSIQRSAAKGNSSLYDMLLAGFNAMSGPAEGRASVQEVAQVMKQAVAQTSVLLELIENHLDHREHRGGEDFTGERADNFNYGLAMLVELSKSRLEDAANGVMYAAFPKKLEPAT